MEPQLQQQNLTIQSSNNERKWPLDENHLHIIQILEYKEKVITLAGDKGGRKGTEKRFCSLHAAVFEWSRASARMFRSRHVGF